MTKWMFNELKKECKLVEYEIKPRMINHNIRDIIYESKDEIEQTNDKPDIWLHEMIKYKKNRCAKLIIDTTYTNIFCKENINNIKNNKISHFMAGKIGEMRKMILYKNKFIKAQSKGYDVAIWSIELIGGTNK